MNLALVTGRAAALLLAAPVAVVSAARLVGGDDRTPVPQLAAFAPWALLGWLVVGALLVVSRWWVVAAVAAIAIGVHTWWLLPPQAARAAAATAAEPTGAAVRAMTINTQYGEADVGAIIELVRAHEVDLLSVQELEPEMAAALTAALGDRLPSADVHAVPESAAGTGLWSRWPLQPAGVIDAPFRMPRATVTVPDAGPLTVTSVHPAAPHRFAVPQWNRDLAAIASAAAEVEGPQLMLGDFNATRDHVGFRNILGTGLVDTADAAGVPWSGFTWPADRRRAPAAVRIDHILVSESSFLVRSVQDYEVPGTDHRAVLTEVALTP